MSIYDEEYAYLDTVMKTIADRIPVLFSHLGGRTSDLIKARQEMWDEGRHLILTFEDAVELCGLNEAVDISSQSYIDSKKEYDSLLLLNKSAYFGRFDFSEGGGEPEKFYIGRVSLPNKYGYLVYDWRAPVSSVYYEYTTGPASYKGPYETFYGEVSLKRQYKITGNHIDYMFDTESAVHDELLAEILSENTSSSLKVIISSIQREQNDAIRNYYCKYLLIYGLAGSGKTSVGLHRMAYILYKYKETIHPENILILSNNNIFKTYISNILPQLGENNVYINVFYDIYKKYLPEEYKAETYFEQLDAAYDEARRGEIKLKNSADFLDYLVSYFKNYEYRFEDISHEGDLIVAKETLSALAEECFGVTIDKAFSLIEDRCKFYFRQNMKAIKARIEKEHEGFIFKSELNSLFWKYVRSFIEEKFSKIISDNNIDEISMYKDILRRYTGDNDISVYLNTCRRLDSGRLAYEDVMLILCIKQFIGKIKPETKILHVLIDEAQDCCAPQLFFLKNLYPKSFFTVLADINQNINAASGINNYEVFNRVFDGELKSVHLYKSYRSSGPINALAFRLLGLENSASEYYDRKGEKPCYIQTADIETAVSEILADKSNEGRTVGIITPSIDEAELLYKALKKRHEVQLLTDPGKKLSGKAVIMPLLLAKGLEFDTAVAVNLMTEGQDTVNCRNTAYLAGSRALHSLYYVNNAPLPELFKDCAELLDIR